MIFLCLAIGARASRPIVRRYGERDRGKGRVSAPTERLCGLKKRAIGEALFAR